MNYNIHEILNSSNRPSYFPEYILIRDDYKDLIEMDLEKFLFDDNPPPTLYKTSEYSFIDLIAYCFNFNKIELLHTIKYKFDEITLHNVFNNLTQDKFLSNILSISDISLNEKINLLQFFIDNTQFNWKATNIHGQPIFFKALEHGISNYFESISDDEIIKHFNSKSVVTKKPLFEKFINQNTYILEKQIPTLVKLYPEPWKYFKEKYADHVFFNLEKQKSPIIRNILMNYHNLKDDIESEISLNTKKNKTLKF